MWKGDKLQKSSIIGNIVFEEGDPVQVYVLLLHPLLLEVQPVHLRLVPLSLQLPVAPQGDIDALLQFLKPFGIAFFLLVELRL